MQESEGIRKVGLAAMGAADLAAERAREAASAATSAAEQVRDTATEAVDQMAARGQKTRKAVRTRAKTAVGKARKTAKKATTRARSTAKRATTRGNRAGFQCHRSAKTFARSPLPTTQPLFNGASGSARTSPPSSVTVGIVARSNTRLP